MRVRLLTGWIAIGLLLACSDASAQCTTQFCPAGTCAPQFAPPAAHGNDAPANDMRIDARAVVRVANERAADRCLGSGTLVDVDEQRGWVLTCGHLFREGTGRVLVTLADRRTFEARLLQCDQRADLAVLEIAAPGIKPLDVAEVTPTQGEPVVSCGYGSDGRLWCNRGQVLGYVTLVGGHGRETLELSGKARSGDSGGPVIDRQGRLVAVLFGTNGRVVDATYCGRVRLFLRGLSPRFGSRPEKSPTIGNRVPPLVPVPPLITVPRPTAPAQPKTVPSPVAPSEPRHNPTPQAPRVELPPHAPAHDRPWGERVGGAVAQAAEPWVAAKFAAVLVAFGLPAGLAALAGGAGAWFVLRRGRKKLQAEFGRLRNHATEAEANEAPGVDELETTAPVVERHHNRYVRYADSALDKAWAAAHARVGEKYPGAIPYLKIVEGVKDQLVSGVDPVNTE